MATLQECRGNTKHENEGMSLLSFVPHILLKVELTLSVFFLEREEYSFKSLPNSALLTGSCLPPPCVQSGDSALSLPLGKAQQEKCSHPPAALPSHYKEVYHIM